MRDELYEFVISGLKARKKRRGGWSLIAEHTGIATKTMSRMFRDGANPKRETLKALADHFVAHPVKPPAPAATSLQ